MARKTRAEVIAAKLREVAVLVAAGKTVAEATKAAGIGKATYYQWLQESAPEAMEEVMLENARLRRAVLALSLVLERMILKGS